jgi:hypothetical protein
MRQLVWMNTYLDDYIMDCQCVPGPSLQASSVWCAILRQRLYLFQYSSKKSNIGFQLKWRAQVPPFGAGPSLSCFCCSRSLSSGDGPGPDHKDYKTNTVFIIPHRMVLSAVFSTGGLNGVVPWLRWIVTSLPPQRPRYDPRPDYVEFVVDKEALECEGN